MVASRRLLVLALSLAAVGSIVLGGVLVTVLEQSAGGLGAVGDPLVLAAVVGLLGVALGAAVANALTGPGGPSGPDGPTPADQRREANEWGDPPGVDVDDDE
ncbi:hypothetical protein [Halorubellus sp. PRR65]|uniref:hypothetical protein n=1 Tax=Halorubellus sp. PRR65 TaxID=3098148 RepID=UPI002B263FEC|nr:hypothetical protein [Halorubellus sp. PRR65]